MDPANQKWKVPVHLFFSLCARAGAIAPLPSDNPQGTTVRAHPHPSHLQPLSVNMCDVMPLTRLSQASERVFVPLTIGGGIRGFKDGSGKQYSALEVASAYFRCGRWAQQYMSVAVQVAGSTRRHVRQSCVMAR